MSLSKLTISLIALASWVCMFVGIAINDVGFIGTGIFTATEAGFYLATWSIMTASVAWTAGNTLFSGVSKNNSTTVGSFWIGIRFTAPGGTQYASTSGNQIIELAATDTLRIKAWQNRTSGGNQTTNLHNDGKYNSFNIHKLS